jgi:predicted solute-binding protein
MPQRTPTVGTTQSAKLQDNQEQHLPAISAVNYLNMLPFFFDAEHVQLFASPQELNQRGSDEGVFCSSLIAGIRSKKTLVTSRFGVFSSRAVMTVFVEPDLKNEAHANFWMQVETLWQHPNPAALETLSQSEPQGSVVLRSAGESAQSVWMFEVLAALAGFKVIMLSPDDAPILNEKGKPLPEARLFIGDKALIRRRELPEMYRLDVGELWATHTQTKPWFAGWFSIDCHNKKSTQLVERFLDSQLKKWSELSEFSRWCKCLTMLEQQFPERTKLWTTEETYDLREELSEYFLTLDHSVAAEQGEALFKFYGEMEKALSEWKNKNLAQPTSTMSANVSEDCPTHSQST